MPCGQSLTAISSLPCLAGILFSIFTVMRLANYLLENHPILIWAFFFGLVLASIYYVAKQISKMDF